MQKYLEERFNEDLVVRRAVPLKKDWYPERKKPTLTLRSWAAFLNAAYNKAGLAPSSGGAVSQAFAVLNDKKQAFKKAKAEYEKAKAADPKAPDGDLTNAKKEQAAGVTALQDAARGFSPPNT